MTISANKINNFNTDVQRTKQDDRKNAGESFSDIMNLASSVRPDLTTGEKTSYESISDSTYKSDTYDDSADKTSRIDSKGNSDKESASPASDNREKIDGSSDNDTLDKKTVQGSGDELKEDVGYEEEKQMSDDAVGSILDMLNELVAMLSHKLGISGDELDAKLQDIGISVEDLLAPDALKDFILNINGATEVDLLIDENLSAQMSDITEELSRILDESMQALSGEGVSESDIAGIVKDLIDSNVIRFEQSAATNGHRAVLNSNAEDNSENNLVNSLEEVTNFGINDDNTAGNENNGTELSDFSEETFFEGGRRSDEPIGNALEMNFNQAVNRAFQDINIEGMPEIDGADIVRQIVDDIEAHMTKDTRTLEVQLNPENLGKVTIAVSEKNGIMQARIIAENEAAKNAIEASLSNLKEAFDNHELKVEAIEVMVATYESFSQGEESQNEDGSKSAASRNNNSLNLDELSDEEELSEQERLEVEMMRMAGNRVNYSI